MDGVIVNNNSYHYMAWEKLFSKYGKTLNPNIYRESMNGRTLSEIVDFMFSEHMDPGKVREIGLEKETMYRKLYQPFLAPSKGLYSLLSAAQENNIPMVVGTSAPVENVDFTMNGLGIRHYFKNILDERSVTKGKPNPEIYTMCAAAINIPNSNCVVFEDAISGIKAGKAAGSKVIGVASSHKAEELTADLIINDFTEITLEQIEKLIFG